MSLNFEILRISHNCPSLHPTSPLLLPEQCQMLEDIQRQIEYYFSSENLARDTYLKSLMDTSGFVDLDHISSFNRVKKLSRDIHYIAQAISKSQKLQLKRVGNRYAVGPRVMRRNLIMLREVPNECTKEDVLSLFKDKSFVPLKCYLDGICWYIKFHTVRDAQSAFTFLQAPDTVLLGKPVNCILKEDYDESNAVEQHPTEHVLQVEASLPKQRPSELNEPRLQTLEAEGIVQKNPSPLCLKPPAAFERSFASVVASKVKKNV
ncbi:hypothetical protein P9112_011053 [Eukaryota sp. TZLM1-RC]